MTSVCIERRERGRERERERKSVCSIRYNTCNVVFGCYSKPVLDTTCTCAVHVLYMRFTCVIHVFYM